MITESLISLGIIGMYYLFLDRSNENHNHYWVL